MRQTKLEIPAEVLLWQFNGKRGNLRTQNIYRGGDGYNLFCTANRRFLSYVKTGFGINLDFTTNNERKVFLQLKDRAERDIRTGDLVALGVGGSPSFLYYDERVFGINLKYSKSPVYEWRIIGASGELGKPIAMGETVALVNTKVKPDPDFLIYFKRPAGSDIGWTTSPGWADRFRKAFDIAKKTLKVLKLLI